MGIGTKLRTIRKSRGWTQKRVAERAGIAQTHLSQIEKEKTAKPHLSTIHAILEALNVNPEKLIKQMMEDFDDEKFLEFCDVDQDGAG